MKVDSPCESGWIVFFGEDWGRHPSTAQYLARELSRERKVLWINSLGLREPKLNLNDIKRVLEKITDFVKGCFSKKDCFADGQDSPGNIHVVAPLALPWLRFGFIRKLNRILVGALLKREFKNRGISRYLLVTACPSSAVIIEDLEAEFKVYYCADEYSELAGMNKSVVSMLEKKLIAHVDLIVATSRSLKESKSRLHNRVEYLPHGVDYELFNQAVRKQRAPRELKDLKGPMVGFVGLIGEHIDLPLIQRCANDMKDVNFVLIGPVEQNIKIPVADNIVYLGQKDRKELASYMSHFDVCINPYVQSERNRNANPTKIREYLAAGCPVVTVPQQEATAINGEVHIAQNATQFSESVRMLIENRHDFVRQVISSSMETETWLERAHQLIQLVCSGLV